MRTPRAPLAACVLVSIAALTGAFPSAQAPALPSDLAGRIDALAAAELKKDGIGGATVGVVKGNALVWAKGYGLSNIEATTPATADTVYRIGSVTKPFTALMLLQLVERGQVRLSDPVERYLPEIGRVAGRFENSPPVTLFQLATMTSGLAREPDDLQTFLVGRVEEWEQVMLRALERTKYAHEPGTRYLYSNIGYAILGATLGRAAKRSFLDHMRREILAPLGMAHSDFLPTPAIQQTLAKGYDVRDGKPDGSRAEREHAGRGYKVPNGALYTTIGDLAKFVALWLGEGPESVLKRATIQDNLSRVGSASGDLRSGYGIGFQVRRRDRSVIYGHGGSVSGYRAHVSFDPVSKTGVIVLRNVGGGKYGVAALAESILRAATEQPRTTQ
jgi:CubicO group peptidase (beta-lactamase class C family)